MAATVTDHDESANGDTEETSFIVENRSRSRDGIGDAVARKEADNLEKDAVPITKHYGQKSPASPRLVSQQNKAFSRCLTLVIIMISSTYVLFNRRR